VQGEGDIQQLRLIYRFWDVASRSLASKHVRAKLKVMIKATHIPIDLKVSTLYEIIGVALWF
jgi:hypothetical protein